MLSIMVKEPKRLKEGERSKEERNRLKEDKKKRVN